MSTGWSAKLPKLSRRWLFFPPLVVGWVVLAFAVNSRQQPEPMELKEIALTLRVHTVSEETVRPIVTGYGLARPTRIWRAVSRVEGQVVETPLDLRAGMFVTQGQLLVRIDSTDYELQVDEITARAEGLRAQIDQMIVSQHNDESSLELESKSLELALIELERIRALHQSDTASASAMERAERAALTQERAVQSLERALARVPTSLRRLRAELRGAESLLNRAKRDLERTEIRAPFGGRLSDVSLEPGQYLGKNEHLFDLQGTGHIEVEASIALDDLAILLAGAERSHPEPASTEQSHLDQDASNERAEIEDDARLSELKATVRVRSGEWVREWPAKVVRSRERVDSVTRTIGVVVSVANASTSREGLTDALLDGMFCEVEFLGRERSKELVVPTSSVKNGKVYILDESNRIRSRTVTSVFRFHGKTVVTGEISGGDRVIVHPPVPAVEGSLVQPVSDQNAVSFRNTNRSGPVRAATAPGVVGSVP